MYPRKGDAGFSVKRADREDIKRILAVYYEQNVTTERFEDFDGKRFFALSFPSILWYDICVAEREVARWRY